MDVPRLPGVGGVKFTGALEEVEDELKLAKPVRLILASASVGG